MFENDFFDFFSRTHWLVVPALWLPISAGLCVWAASIGVPFTISAVAWLGGLVLWTFSEYWLHRTFFHWQPPGRWGEQLHFLVHGVHHKWHQDPYRLVMPPAISLVLGAIFFGLFWAAALGLALVGVPPGWHLGAFSGFVVGYVADDCMHYYLHHFRPKSTYLKRLRAHHMNHHHNDPDAKFGVSSVLWDRVFGTL
jgi:dihydroceramide fatty acyl 2-hydroxylase